eukprot:g11483.t1
MMGCFCTRGILTISAGTVLAAALLVGTALPTDVAAPSISSSSIDVAKAVVSDKFRMVFIAGLEGAGHHYIMGADSAMFTANPDLPRISNDYQLSEQPYYVPSFMAGNASRYAQAEDQARGEMRRLADQAADMPEPGSLYVLHNSWSYPTYSGKNKVMQYIDLQRMTEVARDCGVDMRVLYLRRSAEDILVANTVHRDFQNRLSSSPSNDPPERRFMDYVRILFTNIAVLQSFLSELPPGLIVCHDWDRLGDKDQASRIAEFISPNPEIAELVESSLVDTVSEDRVLKEAMGAREDGLPFEGADALASRLQRKLDAFESRYCGTRVST